MGNMRAMCIAKIIVRQAGKDGKIARLVDVHNIDEQNVREVVARLKKEFDERFVIDTSQVTYARQAIAA